MEDKESLGKYLKRERENRNVSLKEVSEQIKVREPFLKAFEEEKRDLLPSATYVKGFLSAYARYLNLDPNEIIRRYEGESRGEATPRADVLPPKRTLWGKRYLWMAGMGIIVGLTIVYLVVSRPPPRVASPPAKVEEEKTIYQTPDSTPSEKTSASHEMGVMGVVLGITTKERTWVEIQIDGQPAREAMFQPGERFTYRATEQIKLLVGNAGGLEMTLNERPIGKIGKSGEVVTVVLTPRGTEIKRREEPGLKDQ